MRNLDFSSWEAILSTLAGLVLITVIGVGIRLLAMHTIQQRRERENRQINERLRTLIAAYKTLGGSFTGNLEVDPTHLRDLRRRTATANTSPDQAAESVTLTQAVAVQGNGDRSRRVRDAVEAALSDIILLGTEEQVRMAAVAATELVAGRPIHTAELVTSLRDFIRAVLDLDPVPAELSIPKQGPVRPSSSGGGKGDKGDSRSAGKGGGAGGDGAGGGSASHSDSWQEPHH
ncbi:hypothetical protein B195_012185 [Pseudomonas sp. Lz4W]|uniref:hypothetical protein n=1 Tax=Pseudomonas sp. Lz4W TaxID=1206777 RepID=UPI000288EBBA|nr:hypothetical protein [Pseudomonas sp. Lz4W]AMB79798.1 hypothetical protein AV641_12295 [Pseudomonas fragi]AUB75568.1 hypothetical protein B195_012185 [Pseudomonas sp. Lz4W]